MEGNFDRPHDSGAESIEAQGSQLEEGVQEFSGQVEELNQLVEQEPEGGWSPEVKGKLDKVIDFMQNNLGLGALMTIASVPATFYLMDKVPVVGESHILPEMGIAMGGVVTMLTGALMSIMSISKKIDKWATKA
jgi:hypothetical protein